MCACIPGWVDSCVKGGKMRGKIDISDINDIRFSTISLYKGWILKIIPEKAISGLYNH
jgi:hypothetical protein